MPSAKHRICPGCGFRIPAFDYGLFQHLCPKKGAVRVYTDAEKKELERQRLAEEAERKKRRPFSTVRALPPPAVYLWQTPQREKRD